MIFVVVLGFILVIAVLRIVIGLVTRPVDTVQMLGSWIATTVGLLGLAVVGVMLWAHFAGGSQLDVSDIVTIVVSAIVALAALVLAGWLRRRRLRNVYKQHFEAQYAAHDAVLRRRESRKKAPS